MLSFKHNFNAELEKSYVTIISVDSLYWPQGSPRLCQQLHETVLEVCQHYLSNDITKYKIGGDEIIKKIIKNVIIYGIYLRKIVINPDKMMPTQCTHMRQTRTTSKLCHYALIYNIYCENIETFSLLLFVLQIQ